MKTLIVLVAFVCCASAQYAGYGSYAEPSYQYQYPAQRPILQNSHVCSLDVGYGVYGGRHHRNRRPMERLCDDVKFGKGSKNKKEHLHNCGKCCRMTARLNGIPQSEVRGLVLILDNRERCACCAPNRPAVPAPTVNYVQPAASQPIYQTPQANSPY